VRGFFYLDFIYLLATMSNKQISTATLGEAADKYLLPAEQPTASKTASEKAKNQIQETLLADGRTQSGKTATLANLKDTLHVPASYTTTDTGAVEYTTTIARDAGQYAHVYDAAEHEATRMKLEYQLLDKQPTPEQELLIHILAIQKAINQEVWPDQVQAEKNMHELTENTLEKGETTTTTAEVKNNKAEVCTTKSLIARHYLQKHISWVDVTMVSEAGYEGKQEGHHYLTLTVDGKPYIYHPNSPLAWTDLPQIEWLTKEQQQELLQLEKKAA
jgi:hypothetical protein